MTDERPGTRGQEHRIEIDASPEAVWKAISDAEEVTRWFVLDAEIEGRVGGTYRVSWGEGMDGVSDITDWEPGRRLRLQHRPMEGAPDIPTGPIVEEYFIEREGDRTVVRLVTSGIPETEDWDWFYDGTKRGWTIFMLGLRHYLERHAGTPRDQVVSMVSLPGSCEEAWPVLTGSDGLGFAAGLAEASAGDRYEATTAFGDRLGGEILLVDPPYRLLTTVEGLDDALLGITLEQMGPSNILHLALSTYGLPTDTVEELKSRWLPALEGLFPAGGPPAAAFQEAYGEAPPAGGAE
jgi:uncharacterized protein YndB with AHSA1/START domain